MVSLCSLYHRATLRVQGVADKLFQTSVKGRRLRACILQVQTRLCGNTALLMTAVAGNGRFSRHGRHYGSKMVALTD
jgi:hypothetical protein